MFEFLNMVFDYEDRKVAHTDLVEGWVDTVSVNDSAQPYETAVQHPAYNGGKMVIVELYDTKDAAQAGHEGWVARMSSSPLPEKLVDVSSAGVAALRDMFEGDDWRMAERDE